MCLCVCCVYVFVYIYIFNQLSFFPLYKAWELDLISFCHRRKVAQSHIPVCPTFSCVILRVRSCNCVYHPQALSCTALLSALSPTPSSHLFPLKMCLIANHSPWILFFLFNQASLILQHMLHNFPSCCFSFSFSDIFSVFLDSLCSLTQGSHLCMSSCCHSYGLQLPSQIWLL